MRKKIVAGNWKMNLTPAEGAKLITEVCNSMPQVDATVIFCPPYTNIAHASEAIKAAGKSNVWLGAQNCYHEKNGAFTGEISLDMLKALDVNAVIIGHSERRQYFNESNDFIRAKVNAIINYNLTPIFCCGEPLDVRERGGHNDYVSKQIEESLYHLSADAMHKVVIAYEPIWAIGTGKTATTEQAQEMHAHIRNEIAKKYTQELANEITILYGGSCNAANAKELFSQADVDGGLIGGAALKPDTFIGVISGFEN